MNSNVEETKALATQQEKNIIVSNTNQNTEKNDENVFKTTNFTFTYNKCRKNLKNSKSY